MQAERHTFEELAFTQIHAGVIRYVQGVSDIRIDATAKQVAYVDPLKAPQTVQARGGHPIAPHRTAPAARREAGWRRPN